MPGHYGNATKTITGLKIVSLNKETHLIYVSGSVPGAFNSWVTLKKFMKTDLYNLKGEKIGDLTLPKSVFGAKINETLISQAIRVLLSRRRSAHAKTKHRGEVAGSTKKMWAQKGTGRARHSTAKAPQFVGGGSAHGPRGNRNFTLKLTKRMKVVALKSVLSKFAKEKRCWPLIKSAAFLPRLKLPKIWFTNWKKPTNY